MAELIQQKRRKIDYTRWGYVFIAPFFMVFIIFQLIPLLSTFYNSFFENYRVGLTQVGPTFVGFDNYVQVLTESDLPTYAANTIIMWLLGFVPQIIVSLVLALWFASNQLKLKGLTFFKTIIYMPNLIMAAAFSMLFFTLFAESGPVNSILVQAGLIDQPYRFFAYTGSTRGLVALMNFLMWYGNTTILLMAGIMGIDESLIEASRIDGASSIQVFFRIILPLLMPVLAYVLVTSLIGGLQMFDVPQILTNGNGTPNRTTMTLIMYLNAHLFSRNFGLGGAVSVLIFIITALLGLIVFNQIMKNYYGGSNSKRKTARKTKGATHGTN